MSDFNGMSTHLRLFHAKKLGNHVHIHIFCVVVSFHMVQSNTNNFKTDLFSVLTIITTQSQNGPESNGDEGVLYTP